MLRLFFCFAALSALCVACNKPVNWESLPQIKSSAFSGADRAWLVTVKGDLLLTKDGGTHWDKESGETVSGFGAVSFIDTQRGWIVNKHGQVWRTTDGGETWAALSTLKALPGENWIFNSAEDLRFVDELHGWIVETFTIWHTADGGVSWEKSFSTSKERTKGQPVRSFFIDTQTGWVCATGGQVYRTEDGGTTWLTETIAGENTSFTDIYFINGRTGWVTGYMGGQYGPKIYRTDDGGITWRALPTTDRAAYIQSVDFLDEKDGWGSGWSVINPTNNARRQAAGILLHTFDAGQTWQPVQLEQREPFFDRVYFADGQHGWLFGRDSIYRTDDSGQTWRVVLELRPI
jgi:photosystem II stability/assembly factor-like uncharacterized protein